MNNAPNQHGIQYNNSFPANRGGYSQSGRKQTKTCGLSKKAQNTIAKTMTKLPFIFLGAGNIQKRKSKVSRNSDTLPNYKPNNVRPNPVD